MDAGLRELTVIDPPRRGSHNLHQRLCRIDWVGCGCQAARFGAEVAPHALGLVAIGSESDFIGGMCIHKGLEDQPSRGLVGTASQGHETRPTSELRRSEGAIYSSCCCARPPLGLDTLGELPLPSHVTLQSLSMAKPPRRVLDQLSARAPREVSSAAERLL